MSGNQLALAYLMGGAVLGLWAVVRFPGSGPRTLRGALVAFFLAGASLSFVPPLLAVAIHHGGRPGALAGLLVIVLPAATAVCWTLASFIRLVCGLSGRGVG